MHSAAALDVGGAAPEPDEVQLDDEDEEEGEERSGNGAPPFALRDAAWQSFGFQRDEPASDLRGGGMLAVDQLRACGGLLRGVRVTDRDLTESRPRSVPGVGAPRGSFQNPSSHAPRGSVAPLSAGSRGRERDKNDRRSGGDHSAQRTTAAGAGSRTCLQAAAVADRARA